MTDDVAPLWTTETIRALEIARELVDAGVPIFVAPPDPNHSTGYRLPKKWETSTPTLDAVNRWRPGWALCAVMGHNLDLVDVDPRNGGDVSVAALKAAGAWPRSYARAASPSDGWHEFVGPLRVGSRDNVAAGIDVKGGRPDGTGRGFAFVAPTVRVSKTTGEPTAYRWVVEPDLDALAEGDDDSGTTLADMVTQARGGGLVANGASTADDVLGVNRHTGPIRDGSRHARLVSYAGRLRAHGLTLDEATALYGRRWQDCVQPPDARQELTWPDALAKLHDAYRRYPAGITEPAGEDVSEDDRPEVDPGGGDLLAAVRDGAWLDAQTFLPLRYAVPGLVPEGLTLLIGPPKAGKSWLILAVLLALATGGRALGRVRVPKGRVLYLALEDGDRRMQDRCRTLMGDEPLPAEFCYVTTVGPGDMLATIDAFLARHPDTVLIVIDTLGKVMPSVRPDETTYSRDYRVGGRIKAIADARPGLAVVALHHDRKAASEDFVERVSGTNGLAGAADTIVVLARKRQSTDGLLMVTGRDVIEAEYALTMDGGVWTLDGANLGEAAQRAGERQETQSLSDTSTDVLRAVRGAGAGGVKAGTLVARFGKDVYQYLKRLTEAGHIEKPARGLYVGLSDVSGVRKGVGGSDTADVPDSPLGDPVCTECGRPPTDHAEDCIWRPMVLCSAGCGTQLPPERDVGDCAWCQRQADGVESA